MSVKRLRWSAVLLGLVLATSWAGAAQATTSEDTTTTTTVTGDTTTTTIGATTTTVGGATTTTAAGAATTTTAGATTTTTAGGATTTTTEPGGEEQPCSADDGVESFDGITAETAGENPTASVNFTIKEGCVVQLALVSFTGLLDEPGDVVDIAPQEEQDSFFGPGEHSLTVGLPTCSRFSVVFFGFPVDESQAMSATQDRPFSFTKPSAGGVHALQEPELTVLDAIDGETTDCPTESTNHEVAPTTIVEVTTTSPTGNHLPFTGSNAMPILIAGLVLVAGGAAALITSRMRSRQAK
jgi:hypothetical protein